MTGERSNEDDGRCEGCGAFFACTCPSTGAEWLAALAAVRVERDALAAENAHADAVLRDYLRLGTVEQFATLIAESGRAAALQTEVERLTEFGVDLAVHEKVVTQAHGVYDAVRDLLWRATQYGETENGDTAYYLLTKGTVHRLVGAMIAAGESAPLRSGEGFGGPVSAREEPDRCVCCGTDAIWTDACFCDDCLRHGLSPVPRECPLGLFIAEDGYGDMALWRPNGEQPTELMRQRECPPEVWALVAAAVGAVPETREGCACGVTSEHGPHERDLEAPSTPETRDETEG